MTVLDKTPQEIFLSSKLTVLPSEVQQGEADMPTSSIVQDSESDFSTSAYYRDGISKRAKIVVPVQLTFQNAFDRKKILGCGAIQPKPLEYNNTKGNNNIQEDGSNELNGNEDDNDNDEDLWDAELDLIGETQDDAEQSGIQYDLKFQCMCVGNDENDPTVIESVKILSTSIQDSDVGIRFHVEISIQSSPSSRQPEITDNSEQDSDGGSVKADLLSVMEIEMRSKLVCTNVDGDAAVKQDYISPKYNLTNDNGCINPANSLDLAMQALSLGMRVDPTFERKEVSSFFSLSKTYYLPGISEIAPVLRIRVLPALVISVREVSGAAKSTGITLISLLICHSNLHNENVTITNIALHPGQSTLAKEAFDDQNSHGRAMHGGEQIVKNMNENVRWGYASGTAPSLPLILKPQEAFAAVIQINANEVIQENVPIDRTFVSPIFVRALVGDTIDNTDIASNAVADTFRDKQGRNTSMVLVSTDARWTTTPVVVGLTDAFKVCLSISDNLCAVGHQVLVHLTVSNLSAKNRNLMLIMAKDEVRNDFSKVSGGSHIEATNVTKSRSGVSSGEISAAVSAPSSQRSRSNYQSVNNAVVYEVNGYTFGCWGLSGNDDGTVRYTRDHDLLAVDAALLLGEVKSQHSVEAELRFVPLREGTLSVPNLKIYDKIEGKWYDCCHTLQIISVVEQ